MPSARHTPEEPAERSQPIPAESSSVRSVAQLVAGRYRLQETLGRGGMGEVFRALDGGTGRTVALKLLRSPTGEARALFQREFQTLAKLAHPCVIAVYDHGSDDTGQLYYTMELLSGRDLRAAAPLSWQDVCKVLREVATSLALLHSQRLVHRDVNPRNVHLSDAGHAKLLDFGALADFGLPSERVGTPGCIAPEALRREPLDARTDLYSLGVVAYWSLTGRLPYAIHSFETAEAGWQTAPAAPSQYVRDLPPGFDDLLLSLLSVEPLGRPASAADLIDRLGAIAALDEEPLWSIAESHVASSALVARERELTKLDELLRTAHARHGTLLSVVGARGSGKSRLLRELTIRAQLAGFACVALSARALRSPEDLTLAMVRGLLESTPREARASRIANHSGLAELLAGSGLELPVTAAPRPARDHYEHERALRLSLELARLVGDIANQRALLITLDDADLLAPSAACLLPILAQTALGRTLLVAVTRGSAEATPAVEQLVYLGEVMPIGDLDDGAVQQLVELTFGDVPNRTRVARWLSLASRGNPGRLRVALLELLNRRVIRYGGGAWLLPNDLSDQPLPSDLGTLASAELGALSPAARALLDCLALHPGPLDERLCTTAVGDGAKALEELEQARLVQCAAGSVRLAHGSGSELLTRLAPAERREVHRAIAAAAQKLFGRELDCIARGAVEALSVAELVLGIGAGLHLLHAGEERRGQRLLRNGAVELTVRGEGLIAAAPALEKAVALLRGRGVATSEYTGMMVALALAGTYADWRLSHRYADDVLASLCNVAGLRWAQRLAPLLGKRAALYASLGTAFVLFHVMPSRRLVDSFRLVLLGLIGIGTGAISVATVLQDPARARALLSRLTPLGYFPRLHPARELYGYLVALSEHAHGRYAEARELALAALAYTRSKAASRSLPERARLQLEGGVLILLGQLDACRADGVPRQTIEDIRRIETSTSRQTYSATLMTYHANRGERDSYVRWRERTDRLAAEEGSTWRNDVQVPRMLWSTHMMCEDVLTLKRDMEQLRRLAAQIPTVARLRDVLSACYLCERGMAKEALEQYEPTLRAALEETGLRALQQLSAYARILRKAGRAAEAVEICERVLSRLSREERGLTSLTFLAELELPLSLTTLGEYERAKRHLTALLLAHAEHDNPLLHGLIHGACADLALREGDRPAFDLHAQAMQDWLRKTQHPALFAQYHRLCE
ncbi:MAG TPA: serine/threonine-protein kinase, partial [Polyangiales bacterium]